MQEGLRQGPLEAFNHRAYSILSMYIYIHMVSCDMPTPIQGIRVEHGWPPAVVGKQCGCMMGSIACRKARVWAFTYSVLQIRKLLLVARIELHDARLRNEEETSKPDP